MRACSLRPGLLLNTLKPPNGTGFFDDATRRETMPKWSNWSGSLRFTPGNIVKPESEKALAALVQRGASERRVMRVVGAGHSSSALVETPDMLISLEKLQGLVAHDAAVNEATIRAGMSLHDAAKTLFEVGLATHNTGDIDTQMVAGIIGTGTHGTGHKLQNLSTMLIGGRMVTAQGDLVDFSIEDQPDFIRAARVALGTLGIFTELRLRLVPAFKLQRREWCIHIDDCMQHLDELIAQNRNFDFYWYPRSDEAKLRTLNLPGEGLNNLPFARCLEEQEGWSADVLPKKRVLKFDEMEYALPIEAGPACFQEVRQRVKARHRKDVAWRVLYRTIAADDAYLSPAYGRDTVTISLHHNAGMPFEDYFNDIEPIFRSYGGRPHWGKKHNLKAHDLRSLYPMWDQFAEVRHRSDPDGIFMNAYLRELLEEN
jgi:FAD/FMN-containing dehydrogenase